MSKWIVLVYTFSNTKHEWTVETENQAAEHAKRIITEGLWIREGKRQVFYPVHHIFKVKIWEEEEDG